MEAVGLSPNSWKGRRVFVTGATGLVGSWLVRELLNREACVVVLIRDWDPQSELVRSGTITRVHVVHGELEDYATLERALAEYEIDTVFHLGAQTIVGTALRSPLRTFEANIRGTYHLLEACRTHRELVQRVVIASSDKAYGEVRTLPYTEDMPLGGRHPYDVSKACADLLARAYHQTYGTPVAVARCGNIFGGGDLNWSRLIPGTIRSLHYGCRPVIRSDGRYTRDYLYIADAVAAFLALAEALERPGTAGEAFNFAPERPQTVMEVVDTLRRLMGRQDLEPIILNEARAEIRHQYLSTEKARRWLGWKPTYDFETGLSLTVQWYEEFFAAHEACSLRAGAGNGR